MKLRFAKSFERDLDDIRHNREIRKRLVQTIKKLKEVESHKELPGLKKIEGYENYYSMRVGDYRLGMKLTEDTLELIRFLHRKEIYTHFP